VIFVGETYDQYMATREGAAATSANVAAVALPAAGAPLIGRTAELATLSTALAAPGTRLLTLTGPPGVGKTRLALATASAAATGFAAGGRFVDVAALRDPTELIAEIARVLGVGAAPGLPLLQRLISAMADKELLLIVDNCEHVIEAGGELAALAGGCPQLRILATSRERFRLAGEREFPVPPLAMPELADVADLARLAANPSVALLVRRTHAVLPDFQITRQNARAIAEICVRLDGLPLAIELAAARLKLFTPAELAGRLGQRMRLLTGGPRDVPIRHRTLRAAIEWSHDLLTPPERISFRRLSVFAQGWTLEAAEQVCGGPGLDVFAAMSSLVDKSMLRRTVHPDETAEFSMLESLREFAAERLAASGEAAAARSQHAAHFARLATEAEAGIGTADETIWWDWIGREHGNLRAALDHSLAAGDIGSALRLGSALGWYSYTRGYLGEGQAVLGLVLSAATDADDAPAGQKPAGQKPADAPPGHPPPADVMSGALLAGGVVAWGSGDLDGAAELLRRSLPGAGGRRTAIATAFLGHVARDRGDYDEALARYREAERLWAELGNRRGVAWARHDLGLLARERGDYAAAEPLLRDSLDRFEDLGYPWAIAWSSWALGTVLLGSGPLGSGRAAEAAPLLVEALAGYEAVDDRRGVAQCFEALATLASAQGAHEAATRLLAAASALRLALAAPPREAERRTRDLAETAARGALRPEAYDHARHAGRTMPLAAAIGLARSVAAACREAADSPGQAGSAGPAGDVALTPRERQVAALVATGRTNRQIGRALGIAEKTAEVHVHNIMGKLGAHGRAEVAVWAVARGLPGP
jgi:predicted ATPase/DNA-binding CsgD family transcriptional regulator